MRKFTPAKPLTISSELRERIAAAHHLARQTKPAPRGLGDRVERLAKPIARALRMGCLDAQNNLRPESPCAKRRDALNRKFPANIDKNPNNKR